MMKSIMKITLGLFLVVALALCVSHARKFHAQNTVAMPLHPYTIDVVDTTVGVEVSAPPMIDRETQALRSNGDVVVTDGKRTRYHFYSEGITVLWDHKTMTKLTTGDRMPDYGKLLGRGEGCETYPRTGKTQTILGFPTVEWRRDVSTEDGDNVVPGAVHTREIVDSWLAPAINCKPLLQTSQWFHYGKQTASETLVVTRAITGEPDPALFEVPSDASEAPDVAGFYKSIGMPAPPAKALQKMNQEHAFIRSWRGQLQAMYRRFQHEM